MIKQKGFASAVILILLLVGVVTGVYLVQNKTSFLPKAFVRQSTSGPISRPITPTPTYIIPTSTPTPTKKCKTGLNSFSVNTPCGGGYRYMQYTCYDGYSGTEGGPTSCKSSATWKKYAREQCKDRSSCSPTNKPTKTITPTRLPVPIR